MINGNEFKVISSLIEKGAFCVMTGKINSENVIVKVETYKVFEILLSIFLCFPVVGMIVLILRNAQEFLPILILVMIGQILIIRYVFIGLAFRFLSEDFLNRLPDVLDFEWKKNRCNTIKLMLRSVLIKGYSRFASF
ncbi:MAG TPA: hypothetical protein VIS27_14020 [Yeosuana sp.]